MGRPVRGPAGRMGRPGMPPLGRWLVALPAWGDRCVGVLERSTLPALREALRDLQCPAHVIVWSDRPVELGGLQGEVRSVPGPDGSFGSLSACHAQAMADARPGERVLLLTADMVVSREVIATCEYHARSGHWIVCCVALRALEGDAPIGATGRDLLSWAWDNRHPMTRDCTWPDGRSYDVWRTYYQLGDEVAARVFLPHPLMVVPHGRRMRFNPTIDVNLVGNFTPAETYLIASPEEGAVIELSPPEKDYVQTTTMRERMDAAGLEPSCPAFVRCTAPRHRMFFSRRVIIRGTGGDCGDQEMVGRMLG